MRDEVGQAEGDFGGQTVLLRSWGQLSARRVDHGDQRQPQFGRHPDAASGQAQPSGSERRSVPVLADDHARVTADPREGENEPVLRPRLQRHRIGGGRADQVSGPRPASLAGAQDRLPRRSAGQAGGLRRRGGFARRGGLARREGKRGEHPVQERGELARRDDGIDQPVGVQILGGLHAFRERGAVQRLVDARPEEADQGAGLGDRQMPQGGPGGEHPARGGMPQIGDVKKVGGPVRGDRRRDLHHLQEGDGALLHAGATRGGQGDHRQALGGRALDGPHQALPGGHPDRSAQEGELGCRHRHAAPADQARPGDHRLVQPGLLARCGQVGGVGRSRPHAGRAGVPRAERAGIQQCVEQITCVHAPGLPHNGQGARF